jgi:hypothetical protein
MSKHLIFMGRFSLVDHMLTAVRPDSVIDANLVHFRAT